MNTVNRLLPFLSLLALPGQALAQTASAPEARVTEVRAQVEIVGAARHAAATGETLQRGQRISTRANAAAELALNSASVRLGENTTLLMFASPTPPPAGQPPADDTTLIRGTVTVSVPSGGSRTPVSIASRAAVVVLDGGDDAALSTDASGGMRVAVQRGVVRVRAAGREIALRAGSGVRVDPGHPPPAARPLPPAPVWLTPPPPSVLSRGEPSDISGVYAPGGARAAARWHVQVARDEAFTDRVLDTVVAGRTNRFDARQLAPGQYFTRVAAIDPERFESPFGAVSRTIIAAPRVVPGGNGRRARVEIPPGFFCGLDGGPLSASSGALWLLAARPHRVRCSDHADGRNAVELPISAVESGPISHTIRIEPDDFDPQGGVRTVVLRLADAGGMPLAYANVRATANEGASIESFREAAERGVYTATLHWRRGLNRLHLRFVVNDGLEFEEHRGAQDDGSSASPASSEP